MASKTLASPLIRHVATRGFAAAAPASRADGSLQTATIGGSIKATAIDHCSPITRVTIAFKAGSRYECPTELGLSHVLRSAAGLSTQNISSFMIHRKLAQIGATLSSSGDREFVYYTVEATQDQIDCALQYLGQLVSCQEFRPWELSDNAPRLKYDVAAVPPQVRAADLLHRAAYRRGLGNSLYISPKRIGSISTESLLHFTNNNVTQSKCSIGIYGPLEKANVLGANLNLPKGGADAAPSPYYGGELRKEMGGDLAHVALALPGAPAGSKESLALAILAKALGNGPVTKWGADNSLLAKAVGNIGPFAAAGFNVSYSDSGLFGVVLSVPKDEANKAVRAVAEVLRAPKLSDAVIKAGKNQLIMQVYSEAEYGTTLTENLAAQSLYGGVQSPSALAQAIECVEANFISQVASNAAKCKLSMGAAGNLAFVPYVDEL